jgi:hypothetical protein
MNYSRNHFIAEANAKRIADTILLELIKKWNSDYPKPYVKDNVLNDAMIIRREVHLNKFIESSFPNWKNIVRKNQPSNKALLCEILQEAKMYVRAQKRGIPYDTYAKRIADTIRWKLIKKWNSDYPKPYIKDNVLNDAMIIRREVHLNKFIESSFSNWKNIVRQNQPSNKALLCEILQEAKMYVRAQKRGIPYDTYVKNKKLYSLKRNAFGLLRVCDSGCPELRQNYCYCCGSPTN